MHTLCGTFIARHETAADVCCDDPLPKFHEAKMASEDEAKLVETPVSQVPEVRHCSVNIITIP